MDPSQTMNGLFEYTLPHHHHLLFPSWLPLLFPSTLLSVVRPNLESSRIASFHSTLPVLLLTFPTFYSYSTLRYLLLSNFVYVCTTRPEHVFSSRSIFTVSTNLSLFFFFLEKEEEKTFLPGNRSHHTPVLRREYLSNVHLIVRAIPIPMIRIFRNAVEIKFHRRISRVSLYYSSVPRTLDNTLAR